MPRWDYACPTAGCPETTEVIGSVRDLEQNTLDTPQCPVHAIAMERRIAATNFTIKGYAASTGYTYKKP